MDYRKFGRQRIQGACLFKVISILCVCVVVLLASVATSFAQAGSAGRILGAVTDATGGVIGGATVSVTDTQRGITRTLRTDEAGAYNAPELIPGTYSVTVEFPG